MIAAPMSRFSCTLVLICLLPIASLRAQPSAPTPAQVAQLRAIESVSHRSAASVTPFTVSTTSREEVRQFYRTIYKASNGVPMGWTGNYTASTAAAAAGDTAANYKEAVRVRINFFRALVGIPAQITLNPTYNTANQLSALMMSANNTLSHFPPSNWIYYTATGGDAAGHSNLAIGDAGPASITGYMADGGSNNAAVGHRRWLIYPQTLLMGTGDVSGNSSYYPANTTWVIDSQFGNTRPATRTTQVTYPPAGFVPYQLVFPRWSFSYPGADFSTATVTMTRNSQSVAVAPEAVSTGAGEPALVWVYDGLDSTSETPHPKPTGDTTYTVNVNNVKIGAATQNFTYNVIVFDTDVPGNDYAPATVSIASTLPIGQSAPYTVTAPSFASHYEFRPVQLAAFSKTYDAESGLDGITTQTGNYTVVVNSPTGAGTASYRLAKPDVSIADDTLTLPDTFYAPNSSATLTFLSRLGWSTSLQTARVQLALDDGTAWFDVRVQAGDGTSGETSFSTRTVSLAAYAGRTFRVRFVYNYSGAGSYFPQTSSGVGWYLDNISLTGVQTATGGTSTVNTVSTTGAYTASIGGTFGVQARGIFFGTYPMEWGSVTSVTAAALAPITTQPQSHTVVAGTPVTFSVVATGSGLTYQWYRNDVTISSATSTSYSIASPTTAASGSYTVKITNPAGTVTSNPATLTVTPLSYLSNLSVRAAMGAGQTLIVGLVIEGGAKPILVRADGPVLNQYGLTGVVDPRLTLYNGNTLVGSNDNWDSSLTSTFQTLGAFAFASLSKDAALLQTINGPHTAQAAATGPGTILVEAYDAGPNDGRQLTNLSARFQVGTGDNILIAGFNVAGTGTKQVLIRAVGPTLASYGVPNTLPDPQFTVYDGGTSVASNDNWSASLASTFDTLGAFQLIAASKDAALLVTVQAGKAYTVQVSGVANGTGEALVEIYAVP